MSLGLNWLRWMSPSVFLIMEIRRCSRDDSSIHTSSEYGWSVQVSIMDWKIIHASRLASVEQHDLRIKALNRGNTYVINGIRQISKLSINICIHPMSYMSVHMVNHSFTHCHEVKRLSMSRVLHSVSHGNRCIDH